jgi:hypothetical protein
MQHDEHEPIEQQRSEIADILAKAVIRFLTAQSEHSKKDSPKLSDVGLSSSANHRSL